MISELFIKEIINFACYKNEISKLCDDINFEFNSKFTSRFADANPKKKLIRFSEPLWKVAKTKQKKEIIFHETCHIITEIKFGEFVKPHGKEWKNAMKKCGLINPLIYHDVNFYGLKRINHIKCFCSYQKTSKRFYDAIKNNFKCRCIKCGELFKI